MSANLDWLDEQEFDDYCHNYRCWPQTDPKGTVERFKELKAFIRKMVESNGTPVP